MISGNRKLDDFIAHHYLMYYLWVHYHYYYLYMLLLFLLSNTFTQPSLLPLIKPTVKPYELSSSNSFSTTTKTLPVKFRPNKPFLKEGRIIVEIIFNLTRLFHNLYFITLIKLYFIYISLFVY